MAAGLIGCSPRTPARRSRRKKRPEDMRAVLGLVEYRDGFRAAVLALDDYLSIWSL